MTTRDDLAAECKRLAEDLYDDARQAGHPSSRIYEDQLSVDTLAKLCRSINALASWQPEQQAELDANAGFDPWVPEQLVAEPSFWARCVVTRTGPNGTDQLDYAMAYGDEPVNEGTVGSLSTHDQ